MINSPAPFGTNSLKTSLKCLLTPRNVRLIASSFFWSKLSIRSLTFSALWSNSSLRFNNRTRVSLKCTYWSNAFLFTCEYFVSLLFILSNAFSNEEADRFVNFFNSDGGGNEPSSCILRMLFSRFEVNIARLVKNRSALSWASSKALALFISLPRRISRSFFAACNSLRKVDSTFRDADNRTSISSMILEAASRSWICSVRSAFFCNCNAAVEIRWLPRRFIFESFSTSSLSMPVRIPSVSSRRRFSKLFSSKLSNLLFDSSIVSTISCCCWISLVNRSWIDFNSFKRSRSSVVNVCCKSVPISSSSRWISPLISTILRSNVGIEDFSNASIFFSWFFVRSSRRSNAASFVWVWRDRSTCFVCNRWSSCINVFKLSSTSRAFVFASLYCDSIFLSAAWASICRAYANNRLCFASTNPPVSAPFRPHKSPSRVTTSIFNFELHSVASSCVRAIIFLEKMCCIALATFGS